MVAAAARMDGVLYTGVLLQQRRQGYDLPLRYGGGADHGRWS